MFARKPLSVAVHRVFTGVAIAATAASIPAVGQAQDKQLEEIVVTGSRIPTANAVTSSPVNTITAEDLQIHGITRVEDLLNTAPQIFASNTSTQSNGATGTATIDLRGLGPSRTLVLTDGHRMGLGDVFELAPDINQVPAALIDRVEVLTGGASSTYGSDAVAGVVNFVMKHDFSGVQVDYQYSAYQHDQGNSMVSGFLDTAGFNKPSGSVWDGDNNNATITMGANSPDGKGNITAYIGYRSIDPVLQGNRDFSACALNSKDTRCGGSATIPNGLFTPFDGSYYYEVSGNNFVNWLTAGPGGKTDYYNYAPLNYFQRPDTRYTAGMFGHYDLNEHFKAYTEFQFMDDHSRAQIAPSGAFFVTSSLNCSNPYLSSQQFTAIGCTSPTDVISPLYIGRRNVEGGARVDDLRHTDYRILVGLKGDINQDWSYDAFANFSRTIRTERYENDLSTTRIQRALNVVSVGGVPTCQSVVDGSDPSCVPWNIFQTGGVTQAALNYIVEPLFSQAQLNEDQYVGYVNGDLTSMGVISPMAKDGVKVVLGGEYRDDNMNFQPDQNFQSGDGAGQGGPIVPVAGGVDVTEFFTELQVPLVQDRPWIQSLSTDLGYRYSDYSTGKTTNTYKANGQWTPVTGIKFRGGYSRAVRHANINELYSPTSIGLFAGTDPCAGASPTATAAQCANSGVSAAQYTHVPASPAQQYNTFGGGNPNLNPEKADTFTIGAVFQPEQVPNLLFSVDYWNIEVKDAIAAIGPQFILDECTATGDPTLCSQIHRAPTNGNLWIGAANITSSNINIGAFKVSGIDFDGSYAYDVGNYGNLNFHFSGTLLDKWDQQNVPGATVVHCAGLWGGSCGTGLGSPVFPKWKHTFTTTWSTPWNLVLAGTWRFIDGVKEQGGGYNAGSRNYIDLAAVYTPTWLNVGQTKFTVGVNNVTDNDPPVSGQFGTVSVFGNGNTIPGTWDSLGRYFFFGATYSF